MKILIIILFVLLASCKFRTETEYQNRIIQDSIILVRSETRLTDSLIKISDQRNKAIQSAIYYQHALIKEQKDHQSTLIDYDNFVKSESKYLQNLNQQLNQ